MTDPRVEKDKVLSLISVGNYQALDGSNFNENITSISKWGVDNVNASITFPADRQQLDVTGLIEETSATVSVACGDVEQTIDNYTCLYKLDMETMLADDILVCSHWLYPGWDGKTFGDIQDAANKFSLNTLKTILSNILKEDLIYDNCTILRFFSFVFGWKFTRILCLKIGELSVYWSYNGHV